MTPPERQQQWTGRVLFLCALLQLRAEEEHDALACYVACQSVGLSGLLAVFFSGVFVRHYHMYSVSRASAAAFAQTLATTAFLAENFIYLYLGASLLAYSDTFQWDWVFISVSLAATLAARELNTFPLCALANLWRTQRIPWRYMVVMWFSGLRGSTAFALALNVRTRGSGDHAAIIRASTLVTVILTTVLFGATTGPLLQLLGLSRPEPPRRSDADTATAPAGEATPLLGVDALTEVDVDAGSPWSVRRVWIRFDERKPIFGGNHARRRPLQRRNLRIRRSLARPKYPFWKVFLSLLQGLHLWNLIPYGNKTDTE